MTRTYSKSRSIQTEILPGLTSLIKQSSITFVLFILMLILTGGSPPSFILGIFFCVGIIAIYFQERNRFRQKNNVIDRNPVGPVPNGFVNSVQRSVTLKYHLKDNSSSEASKAYGSDMKGSVLGCESDSLSQDSSCSERV
jgi:hypothetical protein